MAYYPYFRGKQFELIALREKAGLIAEAGFIPIIEPVRESLAGLVRTLDALKDSGAGTIVVVNPDCGDHKGDYDAIVELLRGRQLEGNILPGILLSTNLKPSDLSTLLDEFGHGKIALIHAGFDGGDELVTEIGKRQLDTANIFLDQSTGMLYRRRFRQTPRVLVADGLIQTKNSLYPDVERFSDLHVTYKDRGFDGFGDFSIVGDNYSESGGPAWAVAIHITFIDQAREGEMWVYHFKSDTNNTPVDPAGKFLEAVAKLVAEADSPTTKIYQTSAINEFRELYRREHFPGLGYVKKLSIIHHLETMANYQRIAPVQGIELR